MAERPNPLAEMWRAEMRSNAKAYLRSLAIHVVDAESAEVYTEQRAILETMYGPIDEPWPEGFVPRRTP